MSDTSTRLDDTVYVLDQNFPVLAVMAAWPPGIVVSRLSTIAPELVAATEDWEILLELDARSNVAAFVTNDARILDSAREMVAFQQTNLKLIVTDGVGHDSLKATGLLMVHFGDIVRAPTAPLAFRLKPSSRSVERPGARVNEITARRKVSPVQLIRSEREAIHRQLQESRPHLASRWRLRGNE